MPSLRCLCGSQLQLMLDFDSSLILKSVNSQLWAGDLQTEPATEREGPTSSKWVGGSDHTTCQMYKCQNQEKTQELDSSQKHTEIECICRCTSRTSQTSTLSWRRWRRPWIGERSFFRTSNIGLWGSCNGELEVYMRPLVSNIVPQIACVKTRKKEKTYHILDVKAFFLIRGPLLVFFYLETGRGSAVGSSRPNLPLLTRTWPSSCRSCCCFIFCAFVLVFVFWFVFFWSLLTKTWLWALGTFQLHVFIIFLSLGHIR